MRRSCLVCLLKHILHHGPSSSPRIKAAESSAFLHSLHTRHFLCHLVARGPGTTSPIKTFSLHLKHRSTPPNRLKRWAGLGDEGRTPALATLEARCDARRSRPEKSGDWPWGMYDATEGEDTRGTSALVMGEKGLRGLRGL